MKEANAAGIKIVGIHSVANPGPAPEVGLFTNVTCEPKKQGALGASMAIADAKGAAQLVAVTDTQYAIARAKADAAQATNQGLPDVQDARIRQHAGRERQSEHAGILHLLDTEISRSLLRLHGDRRRFLRSRACRPCAPAAFRRAAGSP